MVSEASKKEEQFRLAVEAEVKKRLEATKAKAKGKAKGKVKVKGKAKAKVKARAKPVEEDELGVVKKVEKVENFRARVLREIAGKSLEEALAEARARVVAEEAATGKGNGSDFGELSRNLTALEKQAAAATKQVDEVTAKEAAALDKLRAALKAQMEMTQTTLNAQVDGVEAKKVLGVLEFESKNNSKTNNFAEARISAKEAKANAKKAILDQKKLEKEAMNSAKLALKAAKEKEAQLFQTKKRAKKDGTAQEPDEDAVQEFRKQEKMREKQAAMSIDQEMKEIEKGRSSREKERLKALAKSGGAGSRAPRQPRSPHASPRIASTRSRAPPGASSPGRKTMAQSPVKAPAQKIVKTTSRDDDID